MTDDPKLDRRQSGVHRVTLSTKEGEETQYQFNVERVRGWLSLFIAAITLLSAISAVVWAAMAFGVQREALEVIETECKPGGMIQSLAVDQATIVIEEVQGQIQDNLDYFDSQLHDMREQNTEVLSGQRAIIIQQERNTDEVKMLLQQAISGGGGG